MSDIQKLIDARDLLIEVLGNFADEVQTIQARIDVLVDALPAIEADYSAMDNALAKMG